MSPHYHLHNLWRYIRVHFWQLILLGVALAFTITLSANLLVNRYTSRVLLKQDLSSHDLSSHTVGIVFGGGVLNNQPRQLLQDRLDVAAELIDNGTIEVLLLSGDNRFLNYNEPQAMYTYLVDEKGINPDQLQADFAGRSTYETCERAKKVFGINSALLISESTHLPRAVYLCSHFKIDAYGVKSDGEASSGRKIGQRWREVLARNKALYNTTVYGEPTVLGDPIPLD